MFSRVGAVANNPEHGVHGRHHIYDDAPPPYQEHENWEAPNMRFRNRPNEDRELERTRLLDGCIFLSNVVYHQSEPRGQFYIQKCEEAMRMAEQEGDTTGGNLYDAAVAVEARWRMQGIWSSRWPAQEPGRRWAHEYPLKREPFSDSEDEREYEATHGIQGQTGLFVFRQPPTRPRRYRSRQDRYEAEQRRQARYAIRAHAHALSRPLQQFSAQVADECSRLIEAHERRSAEQGPATPAAPAASAASAAPAAQAAPAAAPAAPTVPAPPAPRLQDDINTMAYEVVKARWKKNGIWRPCWSIMPGLEWHHELPRRTLLVERMGADTVATLPLDLVQSPRRRTPSPTPEPQPQPQPEPEQPAFIFHTTGPTIFDSYIAREQANQNIFNSLVNAEPGSETVVSNNREEEGGDVSRNGNHGEVAETGAEAAQAEPDQDGQNDQDIQDVQDGQDGQDGQEGQDPQGNPASAPPERNNPVQSRVFRLQSRRRSRRERRATGRARRLTTRGRSQKKSTPGRETGRHE